MLVEILRRPSETIQSCVVNREILILGEDRLKIIEFFHTCLKLSFREIDNKLVACKVLEEITQMFFKFEMNSMLHTVFEQIVSSVISFKGYNECLIQDLLAGPLVSKLLECPFGKGYSGHVIRIANLLSKGQNQDCVKAYLEGNVEWNQFSLTELKKRNEVESSTLGEQKKESTYDDFDSNKSKISNFLKGLSLTAKHDEDAEEEFEKAEELDYETKEPEIEDMQEPNAELKKQLEDFTQKDREDNEDFDRDEDLRIEDLKKPEEEEVHDFTQTAHFTKEIVKPEEVHVSRHNQEEDNDGFYWRFGAEIN